MSNALFSAYRRIVEQAWLPIFVADEWDTEILLEGCRRARLSAVEYTLRRRDAKEVIPTLKSRLPDMAILMGSTIDSDEIGNPSVSSFMLLLESNILEKLFESVED